MTPNESPAGTAQPVDAPFANPDCACGLADAPHALLRACGLLLDNAPSSPDAHTAWAHQPQWHVLDTAFGTGLNFLATWAAWRADATRPTRLFYTAIATPPADGQGMSAQGFAHFATEPAAARATGLTDDLATDLRADPPTNPRTELAADLAAELAAQWQAMLPGVHRLVFDGGAVQLTLCVGELRAMLRDIDVPANSVFLAGAPPCNPPQSPPPSRDAWDLHGIKTVARLAQPGTQLASCCAAPNLADHLRACGFVLGVDEPNGKPAGIRATYAPRWTPRHLAHLRRPLPVATQAERHAVVVGAGISGASVAASLAARGWRVTVLDAAPTPAAGASSLPAGVFAPHVSPDDGQLAQLTRAGLRAMRRTCEALLQAGQDWAPTGVLELPLGREHRLPDAWREAAAAGAPHPGVESSRPALPSDAPMWQADLAKQRNALASEALWHVQAGWVRPQQLVRALLSQPDIAWRGGCQVGRIEPSDKGNENGSIKSPRWQLFSDTGLLLENADLVVLTAGPATASLLNRWCDADSFPTHQVHGLISLGLDAHLANPAPEPLWPTAALPSTALAGKQAGEPPPALPNGQPAHAGLTATVPAAGAPAPNSPIAPSSPIGPIGPTSPIAPPAPVAPIVPTPPVNGHGSLLRGIPSDRGRFWCTGASFLHALPRGFDAATIATEHAANVQRLAELLPLVAPSARQQLRANQLWHWHGARSTVGDRVPLVGPVTPRNAPDTTAAPWVCTAMGARGMTLAVLCGELLAAWLHGEPLPMASALAAKLQANRFRTPPD